MTENDMADAVAQALKDIGSKAVVLYVRRRADEAATWDIAFDGEPGVEIPTGVTIGCAPSEGQEAITRKVRAELDSQKAH